MSLLMKQDDLDSIDLLTALSNSSVEYLRSIINHQAPSPINASLVKHHIVHTDPHLDEYFAELFFRAASPEIKNIEFIEESLFSETNDFGAQLLWPEAIVFGIGSSVSYNVNPVLIFDEHSPEGKRFSSCSEMVVEYFKTTTHTKIPISIQIILKEINTIDKFGNAHPQHLNNLIKQLHNVRFLFSKGLKSSDDIRDYLSVTWKRALVDAFITGMIYALENKKDVFGDFQNKKDVLQRSLDHYIHHSLHKSHPLFESARQKIASNIGNQKQVFDDAVLKDVGGNALIDSKGNHICQLLILSRICDACNFAWGEKITNALMMHLWEIEFQKQINFLTLIDELNSIPITSKSYDKRAPVGLIRREILGAVEISSEVFDKRLQRKKDVKLKAPIWVLNIVQGVNVFNANQSGLNYINTKNNGCGILLLEDPVLQTKTLFRAKSFPNGKWINLIKAVKTIEPTCWHDESTDLNNPAPFINNGSKAHQYPQRSGLDLYSLCKLIERA